MSRKYLIIFLNVIICVDAFVFGTRMATRFFKSSHDSLSPAKLMMAVASRALTIRAFLKEEQNSHRWWGQKTDVRQSKLAILLTVYRKPKGVYTMTCKQIDRHLFVVILLVLFPTAWVCALEIAKRGGHAFVEDHDDFDANLVDEATIEMWIYLKRAPKFRESWILLHKEGSYMVTLNGHFTDFEGLHPLEPNQIVMLRYYLGLPGGSIAGGRAQDKDEFLLNQWHHLIFIFGKKGYTFYLNGAQVTHPNFHPKLNNSNFPLSIGGTGIFDTIFLPNDKEKRLPFTGGLIDEVRVSNIVRYPLENFRIVFPTDRFNPDGNTLALWHFDGKEENWLKDASGNEHTLTVVDSVYFHIESRGKLPILWGQIKRHSQ